MIPTIGNGRKILFRDRYRSSPSLRRVKHTGNHALLGLMWSAILVQASHAQVTSNDVSRLDPTEVREVIQVTGEQQVREALAFAAAHHLKVNSAFFNLSRKSEMGKDPGWFLQNTFADNDSVHIISSNDAMRPEVAFSAVQLTL